MTEVNKLNTTPAAATYDLVIVGLGPVGCTAAILCAEAGLKVAAIERDAEVYKLPRAVKLDGEILRAFQAIARGHAVDELMQTVREGERAGFANSRREWLFGHEMKAFGTDGWQPSNMFDQPEFERYLREEALDHPNVTSFIGYAATDITNRTDEVSVVVNSDSEQTYAISARFLLGTDGAASFVRKSIGAGWQDLGYNVDWLVVDVTTKPGHTLGMDTLQVCDPDRIVSYICTKDPYRRWEFKMLPGETREEMLDEDRITSLIDQWTPRGTYEIRRAAVYQFHAATADRWQSGNVFIGGDAAHQTPPFIGQGMNSGLRDVINLAWKLQLVIRGVCNVELLQSYEAERNAHSHDLVDWAVSVGKLMEHTADVEQAARQGLPAPETPAALRSSGYGQGRSLPPLRDGVILVDQVGEGSSTGHLFAQPEVTVADGSPQKLDDLLGNGFALVLQSEVLQSEHTNLSVRSREILDLLGAQIVSLENLTVTRGRLDRLFKNFDAALIRPDRVVFGHTDQTHSVDDLVQALATSLHLANPLA
ncbi:MAG: bifunctional 3-(3-hydroxy-phenyl)propionate/3-hydroxycinnamic acid hydroxylase [Pseudomonadales bacterium]|nr:bifunctional 3-(3-hydroxy-phenyl)propionate/3-hydroxycinnamic acid hydroxylase [Pseudomonadales bacterium]